MKKNKLKIKTMYNEVTRPCDSTRVRCITIETPGQRLLTVVCCPLTKKNMTIKSDIPQIYTLRERVEEKLGKKLNVHSDFVELTSLIEIELRQHISETTLERVWNYSTRAYDSVSLRTLNVLSQYASKMNWDSFCEMLRKEKKIESEVFNAEIITTKDLNVGDIVRFGWLPDRICEARYLGDDKFVAEHCENSTIKDGDTFVCSQFILGKELQMNLPDSNIYIVGIEHGLTTLSKI